MKEAGEGGTPYLVIFIFWLSVLRPTIADEGGEEKERVDLYSNAS